MAQINKPTDYFNTLLWTGNSSTQSITGNDFIADLTWSKYRSGAESHILMDTVRDAGTTLNQQIKSDSTSVEGILNNSSTLTVNSTGFDLSGTTGGPLNFNGYTYATWLWKAGGHTGVSNTDGSITSTVSANTTSGFSIVSYTGTDTAGTIGHGLGVAPKMIIIKRRTAFAEDWLVYHASLGATKNLKLNTTASEATSSAPFNDTEPTSTVFSVEGDGTTNSSSSTYIAYCFAEKKGFSKFGSYTGNGSTDGTFVYTGFKPAFVITKRTTDGVESWHLFDNKRNTFNEVNTRIQVNSSGNEDTAAPLGDFVSNGFKIRGTGGGINVSGKNFIYMAFAENPLVGTNNTPATAR